MVIKEVTKEDMLNVLDKFWKQCESATAFAGDVKVDLPANGIVICGVGGSAISGEILQSYLDLTIPVLVNRSYELPGMVNRNTIVFLVSYSGNTEEVLSCYALAKTKGAKIVGISSGGKLQELCIRGKVPFIQVPGGLQPRDATGYLTIPLLAVLKNSRVIRMNENEIPEMIEALKKNLHESAQEIAAKLKNKVPLIYSSEAMAVLARTWKKKIVENAKVHAFANTFPEMNHNEILGFTHCVADYFAILIYDLDDHPRIKKRMDITKSLLQKNGCPVMGLRVSGKNKLSNIFSTILLGSYVGYYLALEYGVDPVPINLVDEFKKEMGPFKG